jgi:hypothetical protein
MKTVLTLKCESMSGAAYRRQLQQHTTTLLRHAIRDVRRRPLHLDDDALYDLYTLLDLAICLAEPPTGDEAVTLLLAITDPDPAAYARQLRLAIYGTAQVLAQRTEDTFEVALQDSLDALLQLAALLPAQAPPEPVPA